MVWQFSILRPFYILLESAQTSTSRWQFVKLTHCSFDRSKLRHCAKLSEVAASLSAHVPSLEPGFGLIEELVIGSSERKSSVDCCKKKKRKKHKWYRTALVHERNILLLLGIHILTLGFELTARQKTWRCQYQLLFLLLLLLLNILHSLERKSFLEHLRIFLVPWSQDICIRFIWHNLSLITLFDENLFWQLHYVCTLKNRCSIRISDFSDFRQPCISKKADHRAKRTKIWASGLSVQCIHVLLPLNLKFSLGSFGAFLIFADLVSRKPLIGFLSGFFRVYRVLSTVKFSSQFGVTRCIYDFWQPCISETVGRRAKRTNIWDSGVSL